MQKLLNALTENRYYAVYITGLMLFAVGLPLSKTAMSIALFLLSIHWLISMGYRNFPPLRSAIGLSFLAFMMIALIHLAGLLYTTDFQYAMKDLRIKMPLLLLPLFIVTGPSLKEIHLRAVVKAFIIAVFAGSLISLYIHLVKQPIDARDLTPFVSHIRFSMMVCLSIFTTFVIALDRNERKAVRWVALVLSAWLVVFLIMLESLTGVLTFIIILTAVPFYLFFRYRNFTLRAISLALLVVISIATVMLVNTAKRELLPDMAFTVDELEEFTPNGNPYTHDTGSLVNENGHFVWIYVSVDEMREAWNMRSMHEFDSMLAPGSKTGDVLMRYLSSKGLRKDADGVKSLTAEDIEAVERGITNYKYDQWSGMKRRFDQVKWEYWNYLKGGDPRGHSLLQRIELWHTGWALAGDNLIVGVGTGDVKMEFAAKLHALGSSLAGTALRAHNQYLTILITFGITGLMLFLIAIVCPVILQHKTINFPGIVFLIIVLFSMFIEDTLETQVGVSFFIFFYSLMFFRNRSADSKTLTHMENNPSD